MAYTPTEWQTGDVVTAEKLNKIEEGIDDASVAELPAYTAEDEGKVLQIVDGVPAWVTIE